MTGRAAPPRLLRTLAGSVLGAESLVVFFAVLVAKDLSGRSPALVVGGGLGLALACLLVAGLLRWRWAYVVGSLLQLALLASGVVVPAMFLLGAVFAALWVAALRLGTRPLTASRPAP